MCIRDSFKNGEAKKASYSDKSGLTGPEVTDDGDTVYRARIKVEGKYFCFNEKGQMQTGLQFIPAQNAFYYFDDKGYMKTGKMSSVEEENDSFTYYFQTKNGGNGLSLIHIFLNPAASPKQRLSPRLCPFPGPPPRPLSPPLTRTGFRPLTR